MSGVNKHVVELRQSDYAHGTFKMDRDDVVYRFMEDIVWHPNPDSEFRPTQAQVDAGEYSARTNELGFPTANAITAHSVEVDLNGHTFKQSPEHALMQPFHSHFQFGSAPFPPKKGPKNFVDGDGADFAGRGASPFTTVAWADRVIMLCTETSA